MSITGVPHIGLAYNLKHAKGRLYLLIQAPYFRIVSAAHAADLASHELGSL